jgi:hypothetical protein
MQGRLEEDMGSAEGFSGSTEYIYPLLHTSWQSSFFNHLPKSQRAV